MSILYTINQSPAHGTLQQCLRFAEDGDAILFFEDGVFHCLEQDQLDDIAAHVALYCLKEDLAARGLQEKPLGKLSPASYRKFVELSVEFDKVISWF